MSETGRASIGRYGIITLTVYERLVGNTTAIALYGLMALHANTEGRAYPSQETLATMLGVSAPTVRREQKTLVNAGLIEVGKRRGSNGRVIGNEYVVIVPSRVDARRTIARPRAATIARGRATRVRDPLSLEQSTEEQQEIAIIEPTPVEVVFNAWNDCRKSHGGGSSRFDEKRKRLIAKALGDYPLDEVVAAVTGWAHDRWHLSIKKNDLSYLLRDAEHIEKFRDLSFGARNAGGEIDHRRTGESRVVRL